MTVAFSECTWCLEYLYCTTDFCVRVQTVTLLLDLTYNGRFQLAIDVDMVFGRSAYLSVMLTKLEGVARLQFTRLPFTHWSFTFTQVLYSLQL